MIAEAWTYRNPPPDPERDLWWAAQRIAAPDVEDFDQRHQRGLIRLPYDINMGAAGDLVNAWVCCDPACGGVAVNAGGLVRDHACCNESWSLASALAARVPQRMHKAGLGTVHFTGYHHGPFTAWWEPGGAS